jgi:phage protein U
MFGVVGMLGLIPFYCSDKKILTFQDLKRSNKMRFARHEVIGKKPVLEKIGEDLRSVDFSMRLDSNLLGGVPVAVFILILYKLMQKAEPQTLVIVGEIMGKYLIEDLEETRKYHTGAGVCIVAEINIKLTEFAGK